MGAFDWDQFLRVERKTQGVKHFHGLLFAGAFAAVQDPLLFIC